MKLKNNSSIKFTLLIVAICMTFSFTNLNNSDKIIFENAHYSRSSFCIYNDGRFFEASPSGCIEQYFAWGNWKRTGDTFTLNYSNKNIFNYEIIKSIDSQNKFQIVSIIDCYNQPVRFQTINHNTGVTNMYNTGKTKILKNNSINYPAYCFPNTEFGNLYITSNADTITYKWNCNRECLESIIGCQLTINEEESIRKVIIKNKQIIEL